LPSKDVAQLLFAELSGERAQRITAEITKYHRPPGSEGYHAATDYVAGQLRELGLRHVTVERYPLDATTTVGHHPLPLAWEPYAAAVKVVSPVAEEVVDLATTSSCLAWWSAPTPEGGMEAELVDVGTGEHEADFAGKDVAGKIVLIGHTERPGGWMHAAREALKRGAAGIVSDYLFYTFDPHRTRAGLPDAVQLLRLPNQKGEFDAWACSISYPAAQRLRELLRQGPVRLHADIRCRSFAGEGQNLLCTIPGRELPEESVMFVAHTSAATCPCANCAAGPALMVEIARTLHALIERGDLPQPRRSIKFLIIVEGSGSKAHIAAHPEELERVQAAFCFDSVGHDQSKLHSSLMFYKHPDSTPSYINDYFAGVMERAPKDGTWVFRDGQDLAPVRFQQAPYTPWSDNHIWAGYGIPSPLIMSWPDLYFHTQFLTADKTDPLTFRTVGISTALAAYEIADAGAEAAELMGREVRARSWLRLEALAQRAERRLIAGDDAATTAERAGRELGYAAERDARAVASVRRLAPEGDRARLDADLARDADALRRAAEGLVERIRARGAGRAAAATPSAGPLAPRARALARVPQRTTDEPITALGSLGYHELVALHAALAAQDRTIIFDTLRPVADEVWNLVDGERDVGAILEGLCLQFELDVDPATLLPLMDGMARSGHVVYADATNGER
jgi:aminopeptidase YwaD